MSLRDEIDQAAAHIARSIAPSTPCVGVVLGSGLGAFAEGLKAAVAIPYDDIEGFPGSTVVGHRGRVVAGLSGTAPVLVLQGRVHAYEGHPLERVVLPVRALIAAGCKTLIITNAAGAIRHDVDAGDLVLIRDHINLMGANPLSGPNDERLGPRFPDMCEAYDLELRALAQAQAAQAGLTLEEGVYCAVSGPSYETPAEIQMLRTLGADLVGMSTVPEVIAARHMGARVLGISCVTNKAAGHGATLSHDEVTATAARAVPNFVTLLTRIVESL